MVPIGMVVTTVTDFQFHVSPEDFFGNTATVVGAVIQPVWEERRKVITNSLYLFIFWSWNSLSMHGISSSALGNILKVMMYYYLILDLEDKVHFNGGGNVMSPHRPIKPKGHLGNTWLVLKQRRGYGKIIMRVVFSNSSSLAFFFL